MRLAGVWFICIMLMAKNPTHIQFTPKSSNFDIHPTTTQKYKALFGYMG
jgi:hypothetical protein